MNFKKLIENAESEAHKKALAKGLTYKGFGYWADNTGKVVARSSGDDLKPVGAGGEDVAAGGAEQPGGVGSFDQMMDAGAASMGQETPMGEVLPGEEKAKKDTNWEPGPDGSNMVDNPEDTEVEDDAFVDKDEDSDDWVAGPDGSNFKDTKSFDKMQEAANWTGKSQGEPLIPDSNSPRGKQAKHEAEKRGLVSDGHGYWVDSANNPVAKTVDGKLVDLTPQEIKRHDLGERIPGRTTMRDMVKGKRPAEGIMKNRVNDAKDALANLSPSERDKYIDQKAATKDGTYKDGKDKGPYDKAMDMQKAIDKMARGDYAKTKQVEELNQESKQYFTDPEYDLSNDNLGESIGEGAFGSVYLAEDGENVIKDGQIGRSEMQALDILKDLPGFPKLVNANFTSTFKSIQNWEDGVSADPDDSPETMGNTFWHESEAAMGRYAMSLADGQPVSDAQYNWDEISQETAASNFWNLMAEMHKRGVSHNDLHGGNIFFNDELEPTILDMGLARVDKLTAFMEALASQSDNNYQMASALGMVNLPQEQIDLLEENRIKMIEEISDDYSDESWSEEDRDRITELIQGDIRMSQSELDEAREALELVDEQLQKYIDMLYEGIGVQPKDDRPELVRRMEGGYNKMLDKIAAANGFSDGEAMKGMFNVANDINRKKYGKDIDFKGVDITRNPRQNK